MKSSSLTLLFASATSATFYRRQNDGCCFHLASVGSVNETVEENHVGDLSIGGSFQQGGFCLDQSTKTIKDGLKNNCFMRAPDYQFECYAGAVGATAFEITQQGSDGESYLTYDGGPGFFYACPIGSHPDQTYNIYSTEKADTSGCQKISLALVDQTSACSATNVTSGTASASVQQTVPVFRSTTQAVLGHPTSTLTASTTSTSNPQSTASSNVCSVAPSSPSIAPYNIGYSDVSAEGGIKDTAGEASITPLNHTIFQYSIPRSFPPVVENAKQQMCALQFRMPVCTELPKGYPCYSFSGLEQEIVSHSGMTFDLTADDGVTEWDGTALHQVFPGENTIIGTFECSKPKGSYGAIHELQWNVSSVKDFSLEFLHAGVGEDAQFQDGIGAWIVPCQ